MKNNKGKIFGRTFEIPGSTLIDQTIKSFTLAEKAFFWFFVALLSASSLGLLWKLNDAISIEIPSSGGEVIEGITGFPRFINPLLAISDADRDLANLVYSGLMKTSADGTLKTDLASSYEISNDGKTYTFTLKKDLSFHDNHPLTTRDIAFTIESAQNELLKSPKRPNWVGVEVEVIDEERIAFHLKQPYAPFLDNATIGILPMHIWQNLDAEQFPFSQFNIEPIGSGPYKVTSIKRNSSGVADLYELKPFSNYAKGKPYISLFRLKFFPNEETLVKAYQKGDVQGINGISPEKAKEFEATGKRVESIPLTRIFGIFFNQNQAPVLAHKEVRLAIDKSIDKNRIAEVVLAGYGRPIDSPIPPGILRQNSTFSGNPNIEEAKSILEKNDWVINDEGVWQKKTSKGTDILSFSISTGDAPELKKAVDIIKENLESLGAKVDVKIFETGALNQTVIRPRKYEALLFGKIIGRDLDLFAFWHSSQRNDPGLNVSLYTNITTDNLLEEARSITNFEDRLSKFEEFENEVRSDMPGIFLYSPEFIYIMPNKIKGFGMNNITIPSERFNNVEDWYIDTDKVWTFIAKLINKN